VKFQGRTTMVTRGGSYLVGVGYTLAMLCHVDGTWNEQGNDCVSCASGIATASGSDVTSCSLKNPSIHLSFRLRISSNTPSVSKEYYSLVLLPPHKEMTLSVLQILA
jgi:hypothetical protein